MPRKPQTPSYRLHKPTGQAVVTINGRDRYLGAHDTPASREMYHRLIAEWEGRGRVPTVAAGAGAVAVPALTVGQLALKYLAHADAYYRHADGSPTSEPETLRQAMRPMNRLYASLPASDFSPLKLDAVRDEMIRMGWTRQNINRQVKRLQQMFKWGVSKELISESVYVKISTVGGLRAGHPGVSESAKVTSVPLATIESTMPYLPPVVATLVRLQLATGARPGELVNMRAAEIEMDGDTWTYRPATHKTAHLDIAREIPLGPKSREILRPYLKPTLNAFLFNPSEAEKSRSAQRREARRTPLTPSQRRRDRRTAPETGKGEAYTVDTYRRAISRACDRAFPLPADLEAKHKAIRKWVDKWTYDHKGKAPKLAVYPAELLADHEAVEAFRREHRWHPHQLRHNAATALKKKFGKDAARAVLGHTTTKMTEDYFDDEDTVLAREVMEAVG